jgi:hypothetical protein
MPGFADCNIAERAESEMALTARKAQAAIQERMTRYGQIPGGAPLSLHVFAASAALRLLRS